jgi:hypothetical protein
MLDYSLVIIMLQATFNGLNIYTDAMKSESNGDARQFQAQAHIAAVNAFSSVLTAGKLHDNLCLQTHRFHGIIDGRYHAFPESLY